MTFNMLIVDDEPIICRGLATTIPWNDHDLEVTDIAYDGDEAIAKITKNKGIDLVITDVKMPNKDGLELSVYLSENYPETKVIIISGYDEFKYAQQAIQLGVHDYLLKPVDIDELLKVVRKVTSEFKKTQLETEHYQHANLMNALYHQVFNYPIKVPEELVVFQHERIYPFLTMVKNYMQITKNMDPEELNSFKLQWKNAVDDHLASKGLTTISIFLSENMLLTCVKDDRNNLLAKDFVPLANEMESNQILFILHETSTEVKNINQATNLLIENVKYLPINTEQMVIDSTVEKLCEANYSYPIQLEDNLTESIVQFNQRGISDYTNQLFNYLQVNQLLLEDIVNVCSKILNKVVNRLRNLLQKESAVVPFHFNQGIDFLLFDSYDLLQELFEQDIEKVIYAFKLKDVESKDWLMERAIDYIKSYYKSEIKAQEVADVINISPNYFSSLFKQKTGKNFNEYVNHMRIEEAKKLLAETPFKVSEIAEQVGFHEYKYFVGVFKKYAGMTPTKFRKFTTVKND